MTNSPTPQLDSEELNPIDGFLLEMLGDRHRHLCASCNGAENGCINCRGTGYDQTPCLICDKDGIAFRNRREFLDKVSKYIQADRAAFADRVLAAVPEYSGDWNGFIGDKLNDERHRNKWFRIGWNAYHDQATTAITNLVAEERGEK